MTIRRCCWLLLAALLAGCANKSDPAPGSGGGGGAGGPKPVDEATAAEIKAAIPVAASVPAEVVTALADARPVQIKPEHAKNATLTWAVIWLKPGLADRGEEDLDFGPEPSPLKIADAISKSKDKGYATLIQPEYITDFTCNVDGDTATGVVSFKAEGAYKGKAEYRAKRTGGKWVVEEFKMPKLGLTVTRVKDGEWTQTLNPPPRKIDDRLKTDDRLKGDAAKLQGTWTLTRPEGSTDLVERKTRVVKGDTVTETWIVEERLPFTFTSKFALVQDGAHKVVVFHSGTAGRKDDIDDWSEQRFRYALDGDTWTDFEKDNEGNWLPVAVWTRTKGK